MAALELVGGAEAPGAFVPPLGALVPLPGALVPALGALVPLAGAFVTTTVPGGGGMPQFTGGIPTGSYSSDSETSTEAETS